MAESRIHGIDVARGLAMLGMVIVHYVWAGDDTGPAAVLARAMEGRAMPLFMLLGGVGAVLVSRRSAQPDRGLLIRAAILFVLGLILNELVPRLAIVLQFYGLLFAVSPLLRRLPARVLAAGAVVATAIGALTYQVVGDAPRETSYDAVVEGWPGLRSLLFDGYYPFFPVAAFFAAGMVVARLDLRDRRVAAALAGVGSAVGIGAILVFELVAGAVGADPEAVEHDGSFHAERLLDVGGHSSMPAWVVSAAGTSLAVLGLSLLVAPRFPTLIRPLALVGTMALSFYVFQGLGTLVYPSPTETGLAREWLTVVELYGGFLVLAALWSRWFRRGPLEALLRVGSGGRRARSIGSWSTSGPGSNAVPDPATSSGTGRTRDESEPRTT